jgi:microcystin degradation protein MlrC
MRAWRSKKIKIAVGGIHTGCSTHSPALQTAAEFKVARGAHLLSKAGVDGEQFAVVTFCPSVTCEAGWNRQ